MNTGLQSSLTKLSNVTCILEETYKYPDLPINQCKEEVNLLFRNMIFAAWINAWSIALLVLWVGSQCAWPEEKSAASITQTQAKLVCACSPVICHTASHQHYPLTSLVELFDEGTHSKSAMEKEHTLASARGFPVVICSLSCILVDLISQAHILLLAVQATSSSRMLRFLSSCMLLSIFEPSLVILVKKEILDKIGNVPNFIFILMKIE